VQIYEPLASNVITDDQDGYGETPNGTSEDVVHIGIPRIETNIDKKTPRQFSIEKSTSLPFGGCLHQAA